MRSQKILRLLTYSFLTHTMRKCCSAKGTAIVRSSIKSSPSAERERRSVPRTLVLPLSSMLHSVTSSFPSTSRFGAVHKPTGQLIYFLLAVSGHSNSLTVRVDDHQIRLVVCNSLGHQREKHCVGGRWLNPGDKPGFLRTAHRVYLPSTAEIRFSKLSGQTSGCQANCRQASARDDKNR